jgi:DNA-binding XRE family transcriptional regulator
MFQRQKFKDYMKDNGISYSEMGRRLGVHESFIRHVVNGVKQPSLAMAGEISDMMGCAIDDLVEREAE